MWLYLPDDRRLDRRHSLSQRTLRHRRRPRRLGGSGASYDQRRLTTECSSEKNLLVSSSTSNDTPSTTDRGSARLFSSKDAPSPVGGAIIRRVSLRCLRQHIMPADASPAAGACANVRAERAVSARKASFWTPRSVWSAGYANTSAQHGLLNLSARR